MPGRALRRGAGRRLPEAQVVSFDDYPTSPPGWTRWPPVSAGPRTSPGTAAHCCRWPPTGRPPRAAAAALTGSAAQVPRPAVPRRIPRPACRPRAAPGPGCCAAGSAPASTAPLKIASGCDRRCSFCAIPRSAARSCPGPPPTWWPRPAGWPARASGSCCWSARTPRPTARTWATCGAEELLPALAAVDGIAVVRVSYLQPAEVRPGLIDVLAPTPGVAPYFDLSFQHASGSVLRAMRRFGDAERFPTCSTGSGRPAGAGSDRTSSWGSPARPKTTLATLKGFLGDARLDAIGREGFPLLLWIEVLHGV